MQTEPAIRFNTDLDGRYANYFQVGHNSLEVLIDFGQLHSDQESARIHTRIIVSPFYAKALLDVLAGSLLDYERKNGTISGQK